MKSLVSILNWGLLLVIPIYGIGQPVFTKLESLKADFVSYSAFPTYGGGMSFSDFNGDGWDDITLTTDFGVRVHFYENTFGVFKETFPILTNHTKHTYSVWIDYDNDGDKDFFSISELGGIQVLQNHQGNYVNATLSCGLAGFPFSLLKGGLFGDFNNDGLLDLYVCEYNLDNQNHMFFQDSNHVFQDVTFISGTGNGLKRTFQGALIDYNNDGLVDFYLANDIFDGNTLYRNNGDSTFTDVSVGSGTFLQMESMGLAVGDFDGDLDLDIHITDRLTDSKLLRNNNDGTFTEVGTQMGVDFAQGFGWGNNFFDADLDGDEDLYVAGVTHPAYVTVPSALFLNNGSGPFTNSNITGDTLYSFSSVLGDFNNDRLTDIAVHNSWQTQALIWENQTNISNSSISIRLKGCASNKDGIGALMYSYSNGVARLYSFHGSQSFLGQSSSNLIIPIVNAPTLDSLKVKWPSGNTTTLSNISSDQSLVIEECALPSPAPVILVPDFENNNATLCDNDSILIKLDGTYPIVNWSSGQNTDSIYISSAGTYTVTVINQFGVSAASSPVSIIEREYPDYTIKSEIASCFNDGSILLIPSESSAIYSYQWSNQSTSNSLSNLNPGVYYVTVTDQGECAVSDSVTINGPTNFTPIYFNGSSEDALCHNDSSGILSVLPSGGSDPYDFLWSTEETSSSINVPAGNYRLTISDSYNCSKDTSFSVNEPAQILAYVYVTPDTNSAGKGAISLDVFGGTSPYSIVWNDLQNQTGDSAINLFAGEYIAQINDSRLCLREIELTVPNSNINGDQIIRSNECDLICTNQANSILVSSIECSDILSKKNLIIQNILGQSIQHNVIFDNSGNANIFTEQTGIIIISTNDGQSCKIIRS